MHLLMQHVTVMTLGHKNCIGLIRSIMPAVCVYYQSFHKHTLLTNAILKQDFIEYLINVLWSCSSLFVCEIHRLNVIYHFEQ